MNATTDQIIAMCFPLLTVAVVWLMGLFVRRRWGRSRSTVHEAKVDIASRGTVSVEAEMKEALERVTKVIQRAERELQTH